MRVATVEGLVTLYYDGSRELYNQELHRELLSVHRRNHMRRLLAGRSQRRYRLYLHRLERRVDLSDECKNYERERLSWQQIVILEGVTEIPEFTFYGCHNIRRVIFADSVIRIQRCAFLSCKNLVFIKWSLRLRYIGNLAFTACNLSSVFIPPRCREIGFEAFAKNTNLSILHIPQDVELGTNIIAKTALAQVSPVITGNGRYNHTVNSNVNQWLKSINNDENFALHRACATFNPRNAVIHAIVQEKGLKSFREENSIGITPSRYLKENPYTDLTEKQIIHDYLMKMMGEIE